MAKAKKAKKEVNEIEVVDPIVVVAEESKEEKVFETLDLENKEPWLENQVDLEESIKEVTELDIDLDKLASNKVVAAIAKYRNNRNNNGEALKALFLSCVK